MKKVEIKSGSYFTMDLINKVADTGNLDKGKILAIKAIKSSKATMANKSKGLRVVEKTYSLDNLLITMNNFMMAHPQVGLGTIKIGKTNKKDTK